MDIEEEVTITTPLSSSGGCEEGHHSHHQHSHDDHHDGGGGDDDDEKRHFDDVCSAYRQYSKFAMAQWANHEYRFRSLPDDQRNVLPPRLLNGTTNHAQTMNEYKKAVIRNQFCLDCVLKHIGRPHSQQVSVTNDDGAVMVTDEQFSKITSVLKSLARDWSTEGRVERDIAYLPIIRHIQNYMPVGTGMDQGHDDDNDHQTVNVTTITPRICVPGSGLGRLAFELVRLGYTVQGNDYSLHMLLASDFILNSGIGTPDHPIHISPWLLESRNVHLHNDPIRSVRIPDVDPYEALLLLQQNSTVSDDRTTTTTTTTTGPDFSVAAGDFNSIYGHPKVAGVWDVVASCFFLDACPNIVETLQVIYHMLRPGGIIVNFGPLLYHWSGPILRPDDTSVHDYRTRYGSLDERYLTSIDLYYDDVKEVLINIGFVLLEEESGIECSYTADRMSMMNTTYRCVCFVAKKP